MQRVGRAFELTICPLPTYAAGVELRPAGYYALAALIDGPLHGYAIMRRARELSDGHVRLSTGSLYSVLERAIAESLVLAGETYIEGGRQRRDYALTPAGRTALQHESERMAHAARTVNARLRAAAGIRTA